MTMLFVEACNLSVKFDGSEIVWNLVLNIYEL